MISADPEYYLTKKFDQWGKDKNAFTPEALAEYKRCFNPETIHASCEDYRASASIDLEHDKMDLEQGNKISCPLLVLWGTKGFVGNKYKMVSEWRKWADDVVGYGLPSGHYLPEEVPEQTLHTLVDFFWY
jgi:haloacetate dehalogenase